MRGEIPGQFSNFQKRQFVSPHPGPLSWGEGETLSVSRRNYGCKLLNAFEIYGNGQRLFLLPKGEGQDEGKGGRLLAKYLAPNPLENTPRQIVIRYF